MKRNVKWLLIGFAVGLVIIAVSISAFYLIKDTAAVRTYNVPSGAMEPTIKIGSDIKVDESDKAIKNLKNGDIVLFEVPDSVQNMDPTIKQLVKRVVGMPGDVVEGKCENNETSCNVKIYINGKRIKESYLSNEEYPPFGPIPLENDQIFTLGDNRTRSTDGRSYGPVSIDSVIGVVQT